MWGASRFVLFLNLRLLDSEVPVQEETDLGAAIIRSGKPYSSRIVSLQQVLCFIHILAAIRLHKMILSAS